MYVSFANKWKRVLNVPHKYGLCIEHGRFMLHIGFGNGFYLACGFWTFERFYHYRGWKYENGKVIYPYYETHKEYRSGEIYTLYCENCKDYTVWESEDDKVFECTECDQKAEDMP